MKTSQELESTHKLCKLCDTYKEFSRFSLHALKPDGLDIYCKECSTEKVKRRYREKQKNPITYEKELEKRRFINSKRDPDAVKKSLLKSRLKKPYYNAYKASVRKQLRYNVSIGTVKKLPCEICGDPKSQGHHEDYTKPLEVIWLCSKHHGEIHMKFNSAIRKQLGLE